MESNNHILQLLHVRTQLQLFLYYKAPYQSRAGGYKVFSCVNPQAQHNILTPGTSASVPPPLEPLPSSFPPPLSKHPQNQLPTSMYLGGSDQ